MPPFAPLDTELRALPLFQPHSLPAQFRLLQVSRAISTLSPLNPQQHFKWHESRCKLCCRTNISSSSAASLLWSSYNILSNGVVGDGQRREVSAGALVRSPGSLVGSDDRREGLHIRSPDGATRLGRRPHRPFAWATCNRAPQRPPSLADAAHAETSQGSSGQYQSNHRRRMSPSSRVGAAPGHGEIW